MQRTWQLLSGVLGHGSRHGATTQQQEQDKLTAPKGNKQRAQRGCTSEDVKHQHLLQHQQQHTQCTVAAATAAPSASTCAIDAASDELAPATGSSSTDYSPTAYAMQPLLDSPTGSPGQSLYYTAPPAHAPATPLLMPQHSRGFERLAIPYSSTCATLPSIAAAAAHVALDGRPYPSQPHCSTCSPQQHLSMTCSTGPSSTSTTQPCTGAAGSTLGGAGSSLLSSAVSVAMPDLDVSGHSVHTVPQMPGIGLWGDHHHSNEVALPALHGAAGLAMGSIAASVGGVNPWHPGVINAPQSSLSTALHGRAGAHQSAPDGEPHSPSIQHMQHFQSSSLGSRSRHSCQSPTASHAPAPPSGPSSQAPSRQTSGSMQRDGASAVRATSAASGMVADIGSLQAWHGMRKHTASAARPQHGSRGSASHHSSSRASTVTLPPAPPTAETSIELPSLFDDVHITAAAAVARAAGAAWPATQQAAVTQSSHQSDVALESAGTHSNQQNLPVPQQPCSPTSTMHSLHADSSSGRADVDRSQGEDTEVGVQRLPGPNMLLPSQEQFTFQASLQGSQVPTTPTPALPSTAGCSSSYGPANSQLPSSSMPGAKQQMPAHLAATLQQVSHDGPQAIARLLRAFSSNDLLHGQPNNGHVDGMSQAQQLRGGSHHHVQPSKYHQQHSINSRGGHGGSSSSAKLTSRPFHSVHGGFEYDGSQPQARGTFQPTIPSIANLQQQWLSSSGTATTQQQLQLLLMAQQLMSGPQQASMDVTAQLLPALPLPQPHPSMQADLDALVSKPGVAAAYPGLGSSAMSMDGNACQQLPVQQDQDASTIEYLQNYLQVLGQGADDKHIFVARMALTVPALGVLSSFLSYVPGIRAISLVHASIDDDGAVELAIGLRQSYGELWALDLRNNKIGDRGAAALVGCLPACTALRELVVSHNRIGDEGLHCFTEYLNSNSVALRIRASHNSGSNEAVKALASAFKSCRQRRSKTTCVPKQPPQVQPQQRGCESSEEDALRSPAQDLIFDNILTSEDESPAVPQPQLQKRQLMSSQWKSKLPCKGMELTAGYGNNCAEDSEPVSVFANCTPMKRREQSVVLEDVDSVCSMLRVLFAPTLPEEHRIAQDVGAALLHVPAQHEPITLSASLLPQTSAGSSSLPRHPHLSLPHSASFNNLQQLGSGAAQSTSASDQVSFATCQALPVAAAGIQPPSLCIQPSDTVIPIIRRELLAPLGSNASLGPQEYIGRVHSLTSRQSAVNALDSQQLGVLEDVAAALVARGHDATVTTSTGGGNGTDCLQNLRHSYVSVYAPRPACHHGSILSECDGVSTYSNAVTDVCSDIWASVSLYSSCWLQDGAQPQQSKLQAAQPGMSRTASQLAISSSAVLPRIVDGDAAVSGLLAPDSTSRAVGELAQCGITPSTASLQPTVSIQAGQRRTLARRLSRLSQAASSSALAQSTQQLSQTCVESTGMAQKASLVGAPASGAGVTSMSGVWSLPPSRDASVHGPQQCQNCSAHGELHAAPGSQTQGLCGSNPAEAPSSCVPRGLPAVMGDVVPHLPLSGAAVSTRSSLRTGIPGGSYNTRVIVDPGFREQFTVGRNCTPRYDAILAALPPVYVGLEDRLPLLVELLCEEISAVLKERGLPVPPWRKPQAIISRWKPPKSM